VAIASIQVFVCLLSVPMCKFSEVGGFRQADTDTCRYLRETESKFLSQTRYLEDAAFEMINLCFARSLVKRAALLLADYYTHYFYIYLMKF
jgi:hypothetical protein